MKKFISLIPFLFVFSLNSYGEDLIDQLLERAIQNDFKLKSLKHQERAKEYQIEQSKSQYKPQVSFSSYIGWQEYKPYYGGSRKQTLEYYYLSLKQPIYRPEVLSQIKISKLYKAVARLKVEQERQYIKYIFFNTLFDYLYAKVKLDIYTKIKDLNKKKLIYVNKLYQYKRATKEDLNLAENSYQEVYISFKEAEVELRNYKKALFLLTNWNNAQTFTENIVNKISLNTGLSVKNLTKNYNWWLSKLENNFEIREAKKNVEIAKREIRKRKYQRYPKVDLEVSYRYSSTSAVSVASDDKRVALIIDFPFYQGGYVSSLVMEAKELEKSALMDLESIKQQNEFNLKDNYYIMKKSSEKIDSLKKQLSILEELLKNVERGKEKKVKTDLDVINIRLKILETKLSLIEEFHNFYVAYSKLLYLTGALDENGVKKLKMFLIF